MHVAMVIVAQTVLLLFLQFGERALPSTFLARKVCHAGSGLLMLQLDSTDVVARVFVYGVVCGSLVLTWKLAPSWIPLLRFGDEYDAGITVRGEAVTRLAILPP